MGKVKQIPIIAWRIGYLSVLPFFILTLMMLWGSPLSSEQFLASALATYAAVMISFFGAVHWGVALGMPDSLPQSRQAPLFYYSVLPSVLAWLTLLLPPNVALLVLGVLMMAVWFADHRLLFPYIDSDYKKLRSHITMVVPLLLFAAGIISS